MSRALTHLARMAARELRRAAARGLVRLSRAVSPDR